MRGRLAFLLLAIAGCSAENTRVRDARDAFYEAVSRLDPTAIRAAASPDYVSVDRGRFFNIDSLVSDVTLLEAESVSVQFAFVDSATRVDPPMAWLVYRSRRVLSGARYTDTTYAVESATFRREGSGWRLVLLHRTPVASAAEFFTPRPVSPAPAPATPAPAPAPSTKNPRPRPAGE